MDFFIKNILIYLVIALVIILILLPFKRLQDIYKVLFNKVLPYIIMLFWIWVFFNTLYRIVVTPETVRNDFFNYLHSESMLITAIISVPMLLWQGWRKLKSHQK
ncbi:hypothetical protein GC097_14350 [Paenibacillus sp. LMG 31457]|uniref:Uncharacterized protein n=1 Tax=Paenibacillus planticolens TaxID=2654976 RepID=A0ABX1ZM84_9BACL|nr:hypothetical protein [Paenibacillus planticolens]